MDKEDCDEDCSKQHVYSKLQDVSGTRKQNETLQRCVARVPLLVQNVAMWVRVRTSHILLSASDYARLHLCLSMKSHS